MARPKKLKVEAQVETTIKTEDAPIFSSFKDLPEVTLVGMAPAFPGATEWVSLVVTTKGDKVVKVVAEEPTIKPIALNIAKANFVKIFQLGKQNA